MALADWQRQRSEPMESTTTVKGISLFSSLLKDVTLHKDLSWPPLVGAQQDCFAPKWFADAYVLVISLTDSSAVIISSAGVKATNKG